MTEDEAKTKWCPSARVIMDWSTIEGQQPIIGPFNRDHAINSDILSDVIHRSRCIGSACMAWRWESDADYEDRLTEWEDAGNIAGVQRGPEPIRAGFCGHAGRP